MRKILGILMLISSLTFSMTTQDKIINNTLSFEGDKIYMNSMRGIENSTLKTYNKKYGTNWVLKKLTNEQAIIIAKSMYWDKRLDYVHPEVAMSIFDYTFNSNPVKAYMRIHKLFKLEPKPYLSLELVAKINTMYKQDVINMICDSRLEYLKSLKGFKIHGKGWSNRIYKIRKFKI